MFIENNLAQPETEEFTNATLSARFKHSKYINITLQLILLRVKQL